MPGLRERIAPHLCAAIILFNNISFYSQSAPWLRLVELSSCREYYAVHDPSIIGPGGYIEEELCKLDPIQKKMAWLFMLDQLLHFVCDFVATIPLGFLSSRIGPKIATMVNVNGLTMSWIWIVIVSYFYQTFEINMMLLGSIFCIFGGATHTTTALVYSEAAMYTKNRTATFSLMEGIIQVSQLLGPVIGSSLMMIGLYTPFYFAFPIAFLQIPLILCLPSGKRAISIDRKDTPEQEALLESELDAEGEDAALTTTIGVAIAYTPKKSSYQELIKSIKEDTKSFFMMFWQHSIVRYAYTACLVITLGKQALHILLQYVSKRFHITLAQAGFLFSVKAVVALILYTLILPFAHRTSGSSVEVSNVRVARASILLLCAGTTMMGLSWNLWVLTPGLVVYALGFGFAVVVRSLVTHAATASNIPIPILYSGLAIAETAGSFIGATVLTGAFTSTIGSGGVIAGVPFLICSVFYLVIGIPTWTMDLVSPQFGKGSANVVEVLTSDVADD